jgi:DNA processing protein
MLPVQGDDRELSDWLRLTAAPGVGPRTARVLLQAFGGPGAALAAGQRALEAVVEPRVARALSATTPNDPEVTRALAWAAEPGNSIVTLADADYPWSLLQIPDPPVLLYAKGRTELLNSPSLAIVGSRNATAQGCSNAGTFARALGDAGLAIVSGLALGIDTAAHGGGLASRSSTIAVTGTGLDIVYPARNRELAHRIADSGLLLSELPLGTAPASHNFPRRNRLISGLSLGVLVVEAALQSGSLTTARFALEQGREVFAIPGSIHSTLSRGCHALIKQGAKLVESAADVLDELRLPASAPARAHPTPPGEDPVLAALGYDPTDIEILASRCGLPLESVAARLLELELDGSVASLPGGRYQRIA